MTFILSSQATLRPSCVYTGNRSTAKKDNANAPQYEAAFGGMTRQKRCFAQERGRKMTYHKLSENHLWGTFTKYYSMNGATYIDLARQIRDSEIQLLYVKVNENVEKDMQSVSRTYSIDEFLNMSSYIESAAYDIDKLSFLFLGRLKGKTVIITATANKDPFVKFSCDEDIEIEDVLQKTNGLFYKNEKRKLK